MGGDQKYEYLHDEEEHDAPIHPRKRFPWLRRSHIAIVLLISIAGNIFQYLYSRGIGHPTQWFQERSDFGMLTPVSNHLEFPVNELCSRHWIRI